MLTYTTLRQELIRYKFADTEDTPILEVLNTHRCFLNINKNHNLVGNIKIVMIFHNGHNNFLKSRMTKANAMSSVFAFCFCFCSFVVFFVFCFSVFGFGFFVFVFFFFFEFFSTSNCVSFNLRILFSFIIRIMTGFSFRFDPAV